MPRVRPAASSSWGVAAAILLSKDGGVCLALLARIADAPAEGRPCEEEARDGDGEARPSADPEPGQDEGQREGAHRPSLHASSSSGLPKRSQICSARTKLMLRVP